MMVAEAQQVVQLRRACLVFQVGNVAPAAGSCSWLTQALAANLFR
jgi:hypothetical protein